MLEVWGLVSFIKFKWIAIWNSLQQFAQTIEENFVWESFNQFQKFISQFFYAKSHAIEKYPNLIWIYVIFVQL